jgi:hypothetical protein
MDFLVKKQKLHRKKHKKNITSGTTLSSQSITMYTLAWEHSVGRQSRSEQKAVKYKNYSVQYGVAWELPINAQLSRGKMRTKQQQV